MPRVSVARMLTSGAILAVVAVLAVCDRRAVAQQDKYALKLGELNLSDFRGYENWENVAVSQTETLLKAIVANDVMMSAYRRGLPAAGQLFPEGSKVVKIEWNSRKNTEAPYFVMVPGTLKAIAVIEKNTGRFPDTHGWAYGEFDYDAASGTFKVAGNDAKCGYACHSAEAAKDYIFTAYPHR